MQRSEHVSHATALTEFELLKRLRRAPEIFAALEEAQGSELAVQRQLRRQFPNDLVREACLLSELRLKARAKFSRAERMWFDRQGLEQATSEAVARHKARRFEGRVWDYCCGIGGDAIALAAHCEVLAVDVNHVACLRTAWNAEVYGVEQAVQTVCADVERLSDCSGLVHIDPDRRADGHRRKVRIEDCVPALPFLQELTRRFSGGAIKLSPASNFGGKFPGAEIELVSLSGECKEATVWFGRLASESEWRATVLPAGATLAGDPLASATHTGPLGEFLYDPDPAVVRAGLVDVLAERLDLNRLDDAEEYLTGDRLVASPFVHPFSVLAELPNNEREIRRYFRGSDFGQVEIKCRHIPVDADAIRRKLPLTGSQPGTLVFARLAGKARAVICRRVPESRSHVASSQGESNAAR